MSSAQASKVVLVSMIALAAIGVYRIHRAGEGSLYKRLWGVGVVGVALSIAADFAPSIAGPFAALVVLGSLTQGGDRALQNLLSGVGGGIAGAPTGNEVHK